MSEIPHAVLSEQFQQVLAGRRLKAAVFLTFTFEPDFFEQEILPAVMPDMSRSQVSAIRLLQLEDALKAGVDHVAVYYDRAGLIPGSESAKLDIRRIPTHHSTGCFHPKNVLLLTESVEPDDAGHREARLVVAAMSANLTRSGWWENVEACHIEDVAENDACGFREDLLQLIKLVKVASRSESDHRALNTIRQFVLKLTPRMRRSTKGVLHTRLYCGVESVPDFLEENLGTIADGLCLEVISPYFNKHDVAPLQAICTRFNPREVRVFLPRGDDAAALCEPAVYEAGVAIENAHWANLPSTLVKAGKQEQAKLRRVHAKLYRFFNPFRRYEALLVGSVNLTTSAHSKGRNLESAFLIETNPAHRPDWWLELDNTKPSFFSPTEDDEAARPSLPLAIRFDWSTTRAHCYWDANASPGLLRVAAQGVPLFEIRGIKSHSWQPLLAEDDKALHQVLASTSFVTVSEDGGPEGLILVQEEGMAQKPSILTSFTTADILRWWALLTVEQRAAALEDKFESIPEALIQLGLDAPPLPAPPASIFATFAGIYHAFHSLEASVRDALSSKRTRDAEYRLLGQKYDSLPSLLTRLQKNATERDEVEQYVIAMCAQQLFDTIKTEFPWFWDQNRREFRSLEAQIKKTRAISDQLEFSSADERVAFLGWFEGWFLRRASPPKLA
jgi:hypothetical protein